MHKSQNPASFMSSLTYTEAAAGPWTLVQSIVFQMGRLEPPVFPMGQDQHLTLRANHKDRQVVCKHPPRRAIDRNKITRAPTMARQVGHQIRKASIRAHEGAVTPTFFSI